MSRYTKEPWEVCNNTDIFEKEPSGDQVADCFNVHPHPLLDGEANRVAGANARRIVACVNACEGISNEALKEGIIKEALAIAKAYVVKPLNHKNTCPYSTYGEAGGCNCGFEPLLILLFKDEGRE